MAGASDDGLTGLTSEGTVYPLLNRLRDAGLVTSELQDTPPSPGVLESEGLT